MYNVATGIASNVVPQEYVIQLRIISYKLSPDRKYVLYSFDARQVINHVAYRIAMRGLIAEMIVAVVPLLEHGSLFDYRSREPDRFQAAAASERGLAAVPALRHLEQRGQQHCLRVRQQHLLPNRARRHGRRRPADQRRRIGGDFQWSARLGVRRYLNLQSI